MWEVPSRESSRDSDGCRGSTFCEVLIFSFSHSTPGLLAGWIFSWRTISHGDGNVLITCCCVIRGREESYSEYLRFYCSQSLLYIKGELSFVCCNLKFSGTGAVVKYGFISHWFFLKIQLIKIWSIRCKTYDNRRNMSVSLPILKKE